MFSELRTPTGEPAGDIDRVMLLALWARHIKEKTENFIPVYMAGMGKPLYPLDMQAAKTAVRYWSNLFDKAVDMREFINSNSMIQPENREQVARTSAAVDYGNPRGEADTREKLALAFTNWYQAAGAKDLKITAENVLFNVGGAGALFVVFDVINTLHPNGRIITPCPYYTLYQGHRKQNRLHPIDVMKLPKYELTAEALQKAINEANVLGEQDGGKVSALVFSDPSNPLGNYIDEEEMNKIIAVLQKYPEIKIIIDGAYEEMRMDAKRHKSLLCLAPPEMRARIILLRSATKALSLAGERMAATIAFDPQIMQLILNTNINTVGHAPISSQHAFAEAMSKLSDRDLKNSVDFYKPQVELVGKRLANMGAQMPDTGYQTKATFYVLADLSDLIGQPMPQATEQAIANVTTRNATTRNAKTDEDVVYSLMFEDKIIFCPLSYFGVEPTKGIVRITCSAGDSALTEVMDRLEARLNAARKYNYLRTLAKTENSLLELENSDAASLDGFRAELDKLKQSYDNHALNNNSALRLKEINSTLTDLRFRISTQFWQTRQDAIEKAVFKLQKAFRGMLARRGIIDRKKRVDTLWRDTVKANVPRALQPNFFSLTSEQRLQFKPWLSRLNEAPLDCLTSPFQALKPG